MNSTTQSPNRTIIGPLKNAFTPQPSCFDIFQTDLNPSPSLPVFSIAVSCSYSTETNENNVISFDLFDINTSCFPSLPATKVPFVDPELPYSPGLFCPQGYSTACTAAKLLNGQMSQVMQGSSFGFESAYMGLYAGETAFGCCPSGYNCATNTFGRAPLCISTAFAGSITASSCSSGRIISTSIFDVGALTKISTQTTTAGIVEVHTVQTTGNFASITAPMVQLYQRPSDQLPLSVSATSSSPGSTPSKGSPFDPTLTPGKSLPTSAKAAIGIAVASVIILVIAAVRFLLFPRRRRKHIEISQPLEYNKPELDASNVAEDRIRFLRPRELPADIITEMPVEDKMELDATDGAGARFELAATAKTHEMSALSGVESGSTTARDKSWGSQNSPWQIYDKKQTDKPP